jgi:hypothetical protein
MDTPDGFLLSHMAFSIGQNLYYTGGNVKKIISLSE